MIVYLEPPFRNLARRAASAGVSAIQGG
jgi:hypothetical protein